MTKITRSVFMREYEIVTEDENGVLKKDIVYVPECYSFVRAKKYIEDIYTGAKYVSMLDKKLLYSYTMPLETFIEYATCEEIKEI